ncbi:glutathione S-transferase T3-like [Brassica rapa]|uniref:glutathione S-transferase T3-like n=1 Tax=Brassica campestris TaxID=3711 RepID=UPI00142DE528|nr:glutathione S-transferase T3-like [Brassica rapa]XP_048608380.1 glutathione S-transferase T3-like [Brassica napus]
MANGKFFSNLLFSQIPVDLDSPEPFWFGSQGPDDSPFMSAPDVPAKSPVSSSPDVRAKSGVNPNASGPERRKWTPREDKILIGAWLNTSKDPVMSNEQKSTSFWKLPRETTPCKQRWSRINGDVSKFCGSYDAALREQRSGQNDDDVMKTALDIFFNTVGYKFAMDHCWRELRYDQKWCSHYPAKDAGKEKRKQAVEVDTEVAQGVDPEVRPPGVKAAKASTKKKKSGREEELSRLHGVLEIKEKLSKQKLLDRLLAKKEPLSDMENSSHVGRRHGSLSDGVGITGDGVGFTGDGGGITGVVV